MSALKIDPARASPRHFRKPGIGDPRVIQIHLFESLAPASPAEHRVEGFVLDIVKVNPIDHRTADPIERSNGLRGRETPAEISDFGHRANEPILPRKRRRQKHDGCQHGNIDGDEEMRIPPSGNAVALLIAAEAAISFRRPSKSLLSGSLREEGPYRELRRPPRSTLSHMGRGGVVG